MRSTHALSKQQKISLFELRITIYFIKIGLELQLSETI